MPFPLASCNSRFTEHLDKLNGGARMPHLSFVVRINDSLLALNPHCCIQFGIVMPGSHRLMKILLTFTGFHDPFSESAIASEREAGPVLTVCSERQFEMVYL